MSELDLSDKAVTCMWEMQYKVFELKAVKDQGKAVSKQTDGQTKDFREHCGMSRACVPTSNAFKNDGCIEEERAK